MTATVMGWVETVDSYCEDTARVLRCHLFQVSLTKHVMSNVKGRLVLTSVMVRCLGVLANVLRLCGDVETVGSSSQSFSGIRSGLLIGPVRKLTGALVESI